MKFREFKIQTDKFRGTAELKSQNEIMLLSAIARFGYSVKIDYDGGILIREEINCEDILDTAVIEDENETS